MLITKKKQWTTHLKISARPYMIEDEGEVAAANSKTIGVAAET